MLGFPKGAIVNLVVRRVKKMVPAYSIRWRAVNSTTRSRPGRTRKAR